MSNLELCIHCGQPLDAHRMHSASATACSIFSTSNPLRDDNECLRQTLRFYADQWDGEGDNRTPNAELLTDKGRRARRVLDKQ